MYKLREVDKMLLLQSAAGVPRVSVFDQLVIEFQDGSAADLLARSARWTARHPEWAVVDMRYRPRSADGGLGTLTLYVDAAE